MAKTWPKANSDTWDAFAHRAKHVFGQRKHFRDGFDSWPNTYWSDKPLLGFWTQSQWILSHFFIFHDFLVYVSGQVLANDLFDMMLGKLLAKGTCVGQKHCIFITFGHLANTFSWLLSATWNPFEIWYFWWIFDIFQKITCMKCGQNLAKGQFWHLRCFCSSGQTCFWPKETL